MCLYVLALVTGDVHNLISEILKIKKKKCLIFELFLFLKRCMSLGNLMIYLDLISFISSQRNCNLNSLHPM